MSRVEHPVRGCLAAGVGVLMVAVCVLGGLVPAIRAAGLDLVTTLWAD
jgi:hypothetical protein